MYLTFAWRYFKAKKSANAINIIAWVTVGVIAFATACQILVLSVFNGFEELVKSLYSSFYTDIRIVPKKGKTFVLPPAQLQLLKNHPGVKAVSMVAEEKALLQNQNQDMQTQVYLKGVDDHYAQVSGVPERTDGKFITGTPGDPGLILGSGIQNAAGVNLSGRMGPTVVTLILPKKTAPAAGTDGTGFSFATSDPLKLLSEGNATATGVFTIQQDFDNKYAITNIGFVKQQMGFAADEYSAAEIKLKENTDLVKIQRELALQLDSTFNVQTKYEQNTSLYTTMKLEKWAIYAVLTLILLVAAFNMISALTMLVLEKQKDISVLQSMGADKRMILKIFLGEGLLLAGIGAAAGVGMALMVCFLQLKFHLIKLKGGSFLIDYFPVNLQAADLVLVVSTVAFISFLAAWFPARKAANQLIELR